MDALILGGIAVVQSALFLALPSFSRPDILFAVTVPEAFRASDEARRITRIYRLTVLVAALGTVAGVVSMRTATWQLVVFAAELVVVSAAWARANRSVTPHAAAVPEVRVAALAPRESRLPGGFVVAVGPFLILGAAMLFLWINWNRIPDRFPRHWSGDGTPNGWSQKSIGSVYGPLLFGLMATAIGTFTTSSLLTRTRQVAASGEAAVSERRFKRGNVVASQVGCYVMALVFSSFAVRPILASGEHLGVGTWLLFATIAVFSVGMMIWMVTSGQGGQRHVPPEERADTPGDATPDSGWFLGQIYYNPADPALFVEKRMGLGWTLNFGNKLSWFVLAAVVSPIFWLPRLLR